MLAEEFKRYFEHPEKNTEKIHNLLSTNTSGTRKYKAMQNKIYQQRKIYGKLTIKSSW